MGIATSANTAARNNRFLPMFGQVYQHAPGFRVGGGRADRNFQRDVPGVLAMHVSAGSVNTAQGFVIALIAKVEQSVERLESASK